MKLFLVAIVFMLIAPAPDADARMAGFSRRKCERGDMKRCQRLCDQGRAQYCNRKPKEN